MSIERLIEAQTAKCARLREEMHSAPLNKVFQNHDGSRHLGTHSMAWASRSREWAYEVEKLGDLLAMKEEK